MDNYNNMLMILFLLARITDIQNNFFLIRWKTEGEIFWRASATSFTSELQYFLSRPAIKKSDTVNL